MTCNIHICVFLGLCSDPTSWIDVDNDLICGSCTVLADMHNYYTCNEYCAAQGLVCVGAWEDENSWVEFENDETCVVIGKYSCDFNYDTLGTSDAICQCHYAHCIKFICFLFYFNWSNFNYSQSDKMLFQKTKIVS